MYPQISGFWQFGKKYTLKIISLTNNICQIWLAPCRRMKLDFFFILHKTQLQIDQEPQLVRHDALNLMRKKEYT